MLTSLLVCCLFFGLISMILPSGRRFEWIYVLLFSVLLVSVGSHVADLEISFPQIEEEVYEAKGVFPEAAALESVVSAEVYSVTGQAPLSVESDIRRVDDGYELTRISVVISCGNEQEVQNVLQEAFPFREITVLREGAG